MPIILLGTSHESAPVALRERLAYSESDLRSALRSTLLGQSAGRLAGAELAIVSTCNRTELYLAPPPTSANGNGTASREYGDALVEFLAQTRLVDPEEFLPHLYRRNGLEALRHLCRVAAGLDSMVVGEAEVLGQVGEARDIALETGTLGPTLAAAFQHALRAGRRARHETGICRQAASVSSEAVALAERQVGSLSGRRILLVGTGEVTRRAGEVLRERGATDLAVTSRNPVHAEVLASSLRASVVAWEELEAGIRESEIVLSGTRAPHAVLAKDLVTRALAGRTAGTLLLIDIAIPRDVDPEVRGLAGVRLFDLDDLGEQLRRNLDLRRLEVPSVEAIVDQEVEGFATWLQGLAVRPLVTAMRQRAEEIRQVELERLLRRMPHLSADARRQVEQLSHSLVNKLLHEPTVRLRTESDPARRGVYAEAASHLFGVAERLAKELARQGGA
jgi:glutamyl-tRNA reductase